MDWFSVFIGCLLAFSISFIVVILIPVAYHKSNDAKIDRMNVQILNYRHETIRNKRREIEVLGQIAANLAALAIQGGTDPDFNEKPLPKFGKSVTETFNDILEKITEIEKEHKATKTYDILKKED